ncbi:MAG TPA: alpha/beta fold hydrolase [Clostridia bacterium]|nr:alpha/beta fold hydrolase [Clostridia bacterium]
MGIVRRASVVAAVGAAPIGLAYRFALAYRARAGYPRRRAPIATPADLGLPFETALVPVDGLELPAWFIPARSGAAGPGVVLVHGWESGRDRTLPMAQFLHAAGFHCLTFDVRGHGENIPETLPISGGEFGRDALGAFEALLARPEVTVGAISGHSMGAIGAILAGAADPRVAAVVATSGPADPLRLTRQTFRLARLPIPDPVAYPLAWLTTRVYLRPRGHRPATISSIRAAGEYRGPLMLAHGDEDAVIPFGHFERLLAAARSARANDDSAGPLVDLPIVGGHHSWLYEFPTYRRTVAAFLTRALGGPYAPDEAAERAAAVPAERLPEDETAFHAVSRGSGARVLVQVALPGSTRPEHGATALPEPEGGV